MKLALQFLYFSFYYRSLIVDKRVVFSLQGSSILFLIKIGIALIFFHEFSFFITFSFIHFEVELLLVLQVSFDLETIDHVFFLMIVLCSCLVVLLFLKEAKMGSIGWLCSFPIFAFGNAIFKS